MKRWGLLIGLTVGLVVLLGAAGTIAYLLGVTGYAPLAWALVPIAIGLFLVLAKRHDFARIGLVVPVRPRSWIWLLVALPLPLSTLAMSDGLAVQGWAVLGMLGLAVLVALVEETIFRGILFQAFRPDGFGKTLLVTSVAFALAHSVVAISPDADGGAVARTLIFALLFGLLAALLVELAHSLWPAIAVHAAVDTVGFVFEPRSVLASDLVTIGVCAALVIALAIVRRTRVAH